MTNRVAFEKCKNYDFEQVFNSIKKLFELVPPPDVKDKIVLLKPNILYPKKPEMAVCTHPVVVGAAVKAFCELGAKKVIVGESPAISSSVSAAKATGMYDQVINNGGEWVDFKEKTVVPCKNGKIAVQFDFATQFLEADVLVSVSKLKSHQFMSYTGAMKNLFGLIIGLDKAQTHYRFPDKNDFANYIVDINQTASPSYAIMDAIVGMDGPGGPGSGNPIELGFLAASDNILALDWKCAELVGYNPHKVPILEKGLLRKIWINSANEIQTAGVNLDEIRNTQFQIVKNPSETLGGMLPKFLDTAAKKFFVKTPHFNAAICKACGKCAKICPAQIIKMKGKNNTAVLTEKKKCLHCFCCHEICEFKAIKLKKF
ncbi:MAG: DUF362 domain-containing protein [Treponema sp.]|nr:DUF362 domain-containing protein [Treponema sp.]